MRHYSHFLPALLIVFFCALPVPAFSQQANVWSSHALMVGYDDIEARSPLLKMLGLPKKSKGLIITKVYRGSAADKAGLKEGDLVVGINDVTSEDKRFSDHLYKEKAVGSTHTVNILRNGKPMTLNLTTVYPPVVDDTTYERDQKDAANAMKLMREMMYQAYLGNNDRAYDLKGDLRDWVRNKIQQSADEGHPLQAEKFRLLLKEL